MHHTRNLWKRRKKITITLHPTSKKKPKSCAKKYVNHVSFGYLKNETVISFLNMESESYNNGETDTVGYFQCCDGFGFCGGTSGWVIFLIILIVIGCLAAAGAAFWFFYWKRKTGGQDEEEKEVESGEDTTKSGYDISVDTY
ncbi:unnamed protein product [Caenorhabditis nigoni]